MKKVFGITIIWLFGLQLWAQEPLIQTIRGTVTDMGVGYPLIGVNVVWSSGDRMEGTSTDVDGNFTLENIPLGRQSIRLSYIGYKSITVPNILVTSAKESFLYLEMIEDVNNLKEAVISATKNKRAAINEMTSISARSMSVDEITRFSGSAGDVSRMAQNYAGVSGSSDDRNDIIVRGNSPSAVLWRLEGVDIPSPNHWSTLGSTGGPISMLNTNNLRTSDFLSSAFPAEYGNATGAVFDLHLRNGNPEKFEFLGQIGFNGFEGGIEGPLSVGKNASFIANYRYSTLGVFKALGINFGTGSAVPQYQDVNFKINIPTEKIGRFSFWGLGGISDISFKEEPGDDNLFSEDGQNLNTGAQTAILGLNHLYFFNENTSSKISISYSATENYAEVEEVISTVAGDFEKVFQRNNAQNIVSANWTLNKRLSSQSRLKAGVMFDQYDLAVLDSFKLDDGTWFNIVDFEGQASLYRAFGQWQYKFNDKLTLNIGLHGVLFGLNNGNSIEPRFGINFKANEKHSFSLGYGLHSQIQPIPVYFSKDSDATAAENELNRELDLIKSNHFVVGWDFLMLPGLRLKSEAYYQGLYNLAVDPNDGAFSMVNFGADFGFPNVAGLVNDGTGSNYGLELTLEKFLDKGLYFLMTGSLFESTYQGSDEITRNTYYNSNYVFNVLAGKEFSLNEKFAITFDFKVNFAGGRRYTPIDLQASILEGEEVRDMTMLLEAQYDPYIRPDAKIGFRHNARKYSQTFSIDLQNFIGRRNAFGTRYDAALERIVTTSQRGFFPDVRYQILF